MPHNTPISVARADEVVEEMHILRTALEDHGADLAKYRKAVKVLTVAVIVAVMVGAVGIVSAVRAQNAIDSILAVRSESRLSACVQDNVVTEKVRVAVAQSLLALVPEGTVLDAEQQGRVDRYAAEVERLLEYRDCSMAAVDLYYENPPADPATTP